jgi:hypothetical protein
MPKQIMSLLMAATLVGSLFVPDALARGGGEGGLGRGHISSFDRKYISSEVRSARMGSHSGRSRMSSGFAREIDSGRPHCHPDCGSNGCRYLWQYYCL